MSLDYREAAWAIWTSTYERTGSAEQAYDAAAFILRIYESRREAAASPPELVRARMDAASPADSGPQPFVGRPPLQAESA